MKYHSSWCDRNAGGFECNCEASEPHPPIEEQIAQLKTAGWIPLTKTCWKAPPGSGYAGCFLGPHGAWKAMMNDRSDEHQAGGTMTRLEEIRARLDRGEYDSAGMRYLLALVEAAEAMAKAGIQCRCECRTHGFGCGVAEATCKIKYVCDGHRALDHFTALREGS